MSKIKVEDIIKRFRDMRLPVMADGLVSLIETGQLKTLDTLEILEQLTSEEYISRKNNTINRLKKKAHLPQKNAQLEEIDYRPERQINRSVVKQLRTLDYIRNHRNVILLGACGTGKSYISNALGNLACENGYTTYYCRIFEFLDECHQELLLTQSIKKTITKYSKYDVLIIDDFLISSVQEREAHHIFQLFEYRYGIKSTIVCSQLEPAEWHHNLGGNLIADSILDRIMPNAYELILYGESNRK